jgi:hypothetical protein
LQRQTGGTYGITWWLASPTAPEVRAAHAEQVRRARASRAAEALNSWRSDPTPGATEALRVTIDALRMYLGDE